MVEEKLQTKPKVKAAPSHAPAKKEAVPKPTQLNWEKIGREVESVLGMDGTGTLSKIVKVYPVIKKHVVRPILAWMADDNSK